MVTLRHIAVAVRDPEAAARFYEKTFGLARVSAGTSSIGEGVCLTDGYMHLALLKYYSDDAAGRERGKDFVGTHHFGFNVDDVAQTRAAIESGGGLLLMDTPGDDDGLLFEAKFRDPDGIIFDVSGDDWDIETDDD